jgi:hypothetical protein
MNQALYETLSATGAWTTNMILRCLYTLALKLGLEERRARQRRDELKENAPLIENLTRDDLRKLKRADVDFDETSIGITFKWCVLAEILELLDLYEVTWSTTKFNGTTYVEIITRPRREQICDVKRLTMHGLTEPTLFERVFALYRGRVDYDHPTLRQRREKRFALLASERLRSCFAGAVAVHFNPENVTEEGDRLNIILSGDLVDEEGVPDELFDIKLEERDQLPEFCGEWELVFVDREYDHPIAALAGNKFVVFAGIDSAKYQEGDVLLLDAILKESAEQLVLERVVCDAARDVLGLPADYKLPKPGTSGVITTPDGFSFESLSAVDRLVELIIAPIFDGAKINVTHSDNGSQTEGVFHIFYDYFVSSNETVKPPTKFWGFPVPSKQHAYVPSGRGYLVLTEDGFPVGELIDDRLYVFLSMIEDVTDAEIMLFARFLMEARLLIEAVKAQAKANALDEKNFLRYAQRHCSQVSEGELNGEVVWRQLRTSEAQLTREIAAIRRLQGDYFNFNAFAERELAAEFEALAQMPKVAAVAIADDYVIVATNTIYCVDPSTRKRHEMGRFTIKIPFNPEHDIHWTNRTRSVIGHEGASFFHPHIKADGSACLTKATRRTIAHLITRKNFLALVEVLIVYLEAVDLDDDWGKYISRWPLANN